MPPHRPSLFRQKPFEKHLFLFLRLVWFAVKIVIAGAVLALVFSWLLAGIDHEENAWDVSLTIVTGTFAGTWTGIKTFEYIFSRIFLSYFIISRALNVYAEQGNPIFLSSVAVLWEDSFIVRKNDTSVECTIPERKEKKPVLIIRYWVMLPMGEFLYNTTITFSFRKPEDRYSEETQNEIIFPQPETFSLIRGIRQCTVPITSEDYLMLMGCVKAAHKNYVGKGDTPEKDDIQYKLRVVITGTDRRGRLHQRAKSYTMDRIWLNYRFVATDMAGETQLSKKRADRRETRKRRKMWRYFKYQNFNKLLKIPKSEDKDPFDSIVDNSISGKEIDKETYKKFRYMQVIRKEEEFSRDPWYIRFVNKYYRLFYNVHRPLTWLKRKIFENNGVDLE